MLGLTSIGWMQRGLLMILAFDDRNRAMGLLTVSDSVEERRAVAKSQGYVNDVDW